MGYFVFRPVPAGPAARLVAGSAQQGLFPGLAALHHSN